MVRTILMTCVVGAFFLASSDATGQTCRGTATGSSTTSAEIDSDMNGELGSIGTGEGRDSCHGPFTSSSAAEVEDWDSVSYCDFDEYFTPSGVVLNYLSISQVIRYRNGDLMFTELDDSQPSWFCYHWENPSESTYEVHTVITGGTGVFKGATGTTVGTGRSYALQNMGASAGKFTSEINLLHHKKHRDGKD